MKTTKTKLALECPQGINVMCQDAAFDYESPIKLQAAAWRVTFDECVRLGMPVDTEMSGVEVVVAFIRHLSAQAKKKVKK